jgi:serine/threonine protein kinase
VTISQVDSRLDSAAALLVEELIDKLQSGEADVEAFIDAHPEYAERLRRLLPALRVMADLSNSPDGEIRSVEGDAAEMGTLGDFRIVREIGRGGMGVVYEAEQMSLGRRVALKVLPFAATMDPRHLQRFHNEARAAACLHHGHIVPVFYVGCERGVHFYAMQLIEGQTLAAVIRELRREENEPEALATGPRRASEAVVVPAGEDEPTMPHVRGGAETPARARLSTEGARRGREYYRKVAELGVQAAEALDYAHERGVIHRDVKPGNLMLDAQGVLWVTDFGLAHLQQAEGSLTMTGDLVGTLRYMSPEQALAKRVVVDHRTDVYSLGATLYELLTLRPAFDGQDRQELLRQVAFEEPAAPRKLERGIPAELETIVLKAMEKSPADRYATAKELADDLRHWLEDRPIQARRPTHAKRLTKWARRHKAVVSVGMGVAAAASAVLLLGLLWHDAQLREAAQRERKLRQAAVVQRNEARRAVDKMYTQVAEKLLEQEPQQTKLQREFLEEALRYYQELAEDVGEDPASQFDVAVAYRRMARLHDTLGKRKEAEEDFGKANAMLERLAADCPARAEYRRELATSCLDLGFLLMNTARLAEGETVTRKAVGISAQLTAEFPDEPAYQDRLAGSYHNLGLILSGIMGGRPRQPEAEEAFRQAIRVYEKLAAMFPGDYRHSLGGTLSDLALLRWMRGDPKEARQLLQRAIEEQQAASKWNPRHPRCRLFLRNHLAVLANVLASSGEAEEAVKIARRAVDVQEKLVADWPDVPLYRRNLADAYAQLARLLNDRNPREAEAVLRQAVAIHEQLIRDLPKVAVYRQLLSSMQVTLGMALGNQGKFADAVAAFRRALELNSNLPAVHVNLGNVLREMGQLDEAIGEYRKAIRLKKDYTNARRYLAFALKLVQIRDRLPAVLQGKDQPKDGIEYLEFADFCQKPFRKQYAAAARFYAGAFAAQPKLADDLSGHHRYDAACAAALAGYGQGKDAGGLDETKRASLRQQALEWLRAELTAWNKRLKSDGDRARPVVVKTMRHWQTDGDLDGVRAEAALAKLPEAEREGWRKLWADVAATLARAEGRSASPKQPPPQ